MSGWYSPIKGKCTWWREALHDDDAHDSRLKMADKRVVCMCTVEGRGWAYLHKEIPSDCPDARRCRYYIKSG
jgi:hypothetical protein